MTARNRAFRKPHEKDITDPPPHNLPLSHTHHKPTHPYSPATAQDHEPGNAIGRGAVRSRERVDHGRYSVSGAQEPLRNSNGLPPDPETHKGEQCHTKGASHTCATRSPARASPGQTASAPQASCCPLSGPRSRCRPHTRRQAPARHTPAGTQTASAPRLRSTAWPD